MTWLISVFELSTPNNNYRNVENFEIDEKVNFIIKGSNSVYITNDNLCYTSPLKVSKSSVCVNISFKLSTTKRCMIFGTLHTTYTDLYLSPAESHNFGEQENPLIYQNISGGLQV